MIRVWNHGSAPILVPGGLILPGKSIELREEDFAKIKTQKLRTEPPEPAKPLEIIAETQAGSPENSEDFLTSKKSKKPKKRRIKRT